ncbi:MAG TPA: homocysteine S-methyltransferase family protein [Rubrobacter sp.]|jgi:homocysteine S-methyltransferase|nr:homocysteine S-methyltransferase family protein [Rubrobacter sp.]
MNDVQERLDAGEIVILDGAMGTELQRRGVPMDEVAWDAAALATHPDLVREVHEDYIKAGADVIITNTFATARHVLEPAGMGGQFRALNIRAVTLAKEAREDVADGPVFIAGSISTMSARADNSYEPRAEKARENYREQAEVLAESGVDVIVLEMMRDLEQTSYAMEAAVATRLPVWVGFSCKTTDESTVVLQDGNHTLAQAIEQVPPLGASLVSIMHTLAEDTPAALREVTSHWQGPVGAYPHSGEFIMPNWQFINMISPEDFTRKAQGWTGMGVQLVGGCCGIGPEHIRLLKERLARPSSS